MSKHSLTITITIIFLLTIQTQANSSSPPVWVASSFFKAGAVTFVYTGTATTQSSSITYSSAIVNTGLKVPTMGITNLNYQVVGGRCLMQVKVTAYTITGLTFQVTVNTVSYLQTLMLTYMALDASFTPAFSMNYFFPQVNQNSASIYAQFYVNFTSSTGVTLNTSHENVLLPFLHYIDITTRDSTIDLNLNFSLVNGSFYTVIISSTSNMTLNYAGFSRLIFDKTAIEALGNDYFHYGIVQALNNNSSALYTTIPPNILPANLYYGLHSFTVTSGLSNIYFTSSYNVTSGFLGYSSVNPYVFSKMKFSYMHHKTRTCPAGYPYYNISEQLCYDTCNLRWYGNTVSMTCQACLYDCYTCTNATTCATCNATNDFRSLNGTRCSPITGYFDNGTNSTAATACTSPCASCSGTGTYCLSCVSGYYLSSHTCIACSSAITSCSTCTNSSYCTLCLSGTSGATCTSCSANQYLNSTSNTCVTCSTVITNCQSCTSSTSCTLCQSNYTLNSATSCTCNASEYSSAGACYTCSSAVAYCSTCTSATVCTGCFSSFTLASATSCTCNSTAYLNTTSSSCIICTSLTSYCSTCTNTTCSTCLSTFTLSSGACVCSSGYYVDAGNSVCSTCSSAMSHCLTCSSSSNCTTCAAGYAVDPATFLCFSQPCQISNCNTCDASNYSICTLCNTGYSLSSTNTSCEVKCGDGQLLTGTEQCDDGNSNNGDGCSSTCKTQTGFSCYPEYVNATRTYSYCFYTSSITFSKVWIRKIEGVNSLKFQFQLHQALSQWSSVNFASILQIDNIDPTTKFSTGLGPAMISSYSASYSAANNRFSVTVNYQNYTMEKQYLSFTLSPYDNNVYPAFTPPSNIEFFPPYINCIVQVQANNNQNANLYSSAIYGAYSISITTTYAVLAVALLTIATSLVFRVGKIITFEMITLMQLTYFSLSFLDSINPVFSGLLPLRYLAGLLNFKGVEDYLEQTSSPNAMKGIYMFLNLSDNFTFIAMSMGLFLGLGTVLYLIYLFMDWMMNSDQLGRGVPNESRKGYIFYKLAFHFLGELALSLIIVCLPLYSISIIFEAFYTVDSSDFWSYAMGIGVAAAIIIYFSALLKHKYAKNTSDFCKLGEYMSEFNANNCFTTFKYTNLVMFFIALISTIIIVTQYTDNKLFATIAIIFISLVDIVVISIAKPYKFGFVSCFKGDDNETEVMFEKIELYRVYDTEQPQVIRIENPDLTQKSEEAENNSQVFAQHFATRKNVIKSKHQGLIQAGEVLNHTKLFLFNNNFRRIFNLITLIVVEFVFACTAIFGSQINQNYDSVTIQVALPFLIHSTLFLNVIYNYAILILQIMNRTRQTIGKVENQPADTSSQFMKSMYTQKDRKKETEESEHIPKPIKTNQDILKTNLAAKSLYDLKRPQIIKPIRSKQNMRKGKNSKIEQIEQQ